MIVEQSNAKFITMFACKTNDNSISAKFKKKQITNYTGSTLTPIDSYTSVLIDYNKRE